MVIEISADAIPDRAIRKLMNKPLGQLGEQKASAPHNKTTKQIKL
ncbi:hypothetical protein [Macrococcoides caseolyticum]|nr:hypothetical protein [Macrococcus caseolyticus]